MIVKCVDGFYYKNPKWGNSRVTVITDIGAEVFLKYHRPVNPRTMLKAIAELGLFGVLVPADGHPKLPCPGEMTTMIFDGKNATAFRVEVTFRKKRKWALPVPASHGGRFEIAPSFLEDEVVEPSGD